MTITLNGESYSVDIKELSVTKLLEKKKVESPDMVSVQLNGTFLPKDKYDTTMINEGDEVDFLYFMGGGSGL